MIPEEVMRAFLTRTMTQEQKENLRGSEGALPPTLCFNTSQIVKSFLHNQAPSVSKIEVDSMNALWLDFYCKILYPQQQAEEKLHPAGCTMFTCHHDWDIRCRTKAHEMWQWDDYARAHYSTPVMSGTLDQALGSARKDYR